MEARIRLPFDVFIEVRVRPEPFDLHGLADAILSWGDQFGPPATDREWLDALESGLIEPSYDD